MTEVSSWPGPPSCPGQPKLKIQKRMNWAGQRSMETFGKPEDVPGWRGIRAAESKTRYAMKGSRLGPTAPGRDGTGSRKPPVTNWGGCEGLKSGA